jgi:hypothetical protein
VAIRKTAPQEIAQVMIHYFNNLFTSQLPNATDRVSQTNTPIQVDIIDPFTNSTPTLQEITKLIKQMKRDASPGSYGLNVALYRVRTMCGSRTGGRSLPCVMSD